MYSCEVELCHLTQGYTSRTIQLLMHKRCPTACFRNRVTFSPDLSLVVLNDALYRLDTANQSSIPIVLPIAEHEDHISSDDAATLADNGSHFEAMISYCNGYLVYLDTGSRGEGSPPKLEIYRLKDSGRDVAIKIDLPNNLILSKFSFAKACWHPTSPVIGLLTWQSSTAAKATNDSESETCHTLNLDFPCARWVKAKKTFTSKTTCTYIITFYNQWSDLNESI